MKHLSLLSLCSCLLLPLLHTAVLSQDKRDASPSPRAILIEPVATYGDLPWAKERRQLDGLAASLGGDPDLIGYIVVYAGRRACAGEAQARALRAKKYLVEKGGVDANRLIWQDAGHLDRPQVRLETQLRGGVRYSYARPEPLPQKEVRVLNCRGAMSRHR